MPASARQHNAVTQLGVQALIADAVVNFFQNVLNFDVNNRRERLFTQDSSSVIAVARSRRKADKAVLVFPGVVAHLPHLQLETSGS